MRTRSSDAQGADRDKQPLTLNVAQAATYTGFSIDSIRDAIANGLLRAIRVGRNFRIPTFELERFTREALESQIDLAELRDDRRKDWKSHQRRIAPRAAR